MQPCRMTCHACRRRRSHSGRLRSASMRSCIWSSSSRVNHRAAPIGSRLGWTGLLMVCLPSQQMIRRNLSIECHQVTASTSSSCPFHGSISFALPSCLASAMILRTPLTPHHARGSLMRVSNHSMIRHVHLYVRFRPKRITRVITARSIASTQRHRCSTVCSDACHSSADAPTRRSRSLVMLLRSTDSFIRHLSGMGR